MVEEIIDIFTKLGYQNRPVRSEWTKTYDGWESYYGVFKTKSGKEEVYHCPDGDLSQIKKIPSIEKLFETNPYLKKDWRNWKINFLLEQDIKKKR